MKEPLQEAQKTLPQSNTNSEKRETIWLIQDGLSIVRRKRNLV
jgi:hypothetical protein